MTQIYEMNERTGHIENKASYSLDPKSAIIAYIEQKHGNMNTWEYPRNISGIRESQTVKNHYYYNDIPNGVIIASYPYK